MATTVIGNPAQQRKANVASSWALSLILFALIVLAFIGWNQYQASNAPATDTVEHQLSH